MNIHIKWTNIKSSPILEEYIYQKIGGLEKFCIQKIEASEKKMGDAIQVYIEIGKQTKHHFKGSVFYAECQLRLPGKSLRATATHYDERVAIDEVKDELQQLLKQYKEKWTSHMKETARKIKEEI